MKAQLILALLSLSLPVAAQQSAHPEDAKTIIDHTKSGTVVILAGEGAGRLRSIATGVVISENGIVLTALHAVKGAAEVQVRLSNGEVFDRVQLLGSDERRDIAALKIEAGGLTPLIPEKDAAIAQGDAVYAVTNANGLTWSATNGIVSAIRPADEIPGAGSGFRLVQFTAPIAPGSSGGALVDKSGKLVGIITRGGGNAGFAVPIESVLGLSELGHSVPLGSGAYLQMPAASAKDESLSSASIRSADPKQMMKNAKTIFIHSKTSFLTVDTVQRALMLQKEWSGLDLTIVQDQRLADLVIEIDRPLFTYVHTFVITDKRTSIVLDSGKVTAFDGTIASGGIAKDIVKFFSVGRRR